MTNHHSNTPTREPTDEELDRAIGAYVMADDRMTRDRMRLALRAALNPPQICKEEIVVTEEMVTAGIVEANSGVATGLGRYWPVRIYRAMHAARPKHVGDARLGYGYHWHRRSTDPR